MNGWLQRLGVTPRTAALIVGAMLLIDVVLSQLVVGPSWALAGLFLVGALTSGLALVLALQLRRALHARSAQLDETAQLQRSESLYRSLFHVNQAVKLLIDPADGRILDANLAAEEMYGWSRSDLLAMHIQDINAASPDEVAQEMARARAQDRLFFRFRHRVASGELRDVEVFSGPILHDDRTLLFSIVQDVTERNVAHRAREVAMKRLERTLADLESARYEAVRANRAKTEFLANMSHEIRTPLTAILGFAEDLHDPNLSDEERREAAHTITQSGEHLLALLNQLLDLSKVEAGRLEVSRVGISVPEFLTSIQSLLSPRARARGLEFTVQVQPDVPEVITSDPTRLRQILLNLGNNAIKFTERGSIDLRLEIPDPARLRFEIEDTGIGIPVATMGRLFQPFTQADASTTQKYGGSGLGLAISKRLAQLLGGDIRVRSVEGEGSTFSVEIDPRPSRGVMAAAPRWDAPPASTADLDIELEAAYRVLLAEDVVPNQVLIRRMLERAGAVVQVVGDGQQAVEAYQSSVSSNQPFDLILMDVQMPVLDGRAATRALRELGARIPIVALTANVMDAEIAEYLSLGFDDCAAKPIRRSALLRTVTRWCERSAARA